eukprot:TRINITY_DN6510_c0_g1_i1.p2 TRINITY_DN6510_c0_g1~~TRINITY_DN6510_c0_g1_i1.p2  ORF type:complete len:141 (-),score=24.57 TRINITY_DN6510_c0_g1_i1:93-515(-)
MPEQTVQKTSVLSQKDFDEIKRWIPPSHLEEKFGGEVPNLTTYWPPKPSHMLSQPRLSEVPSKGNGLASSPGLGGRYSSPAQRYKGMQARNSHIALLSRHDLEMKEESSADSGFCGLKIFSKDKRKVDSGRSEDQGCILI